MLLSVVIGLILGFVTKPGLSVFNFLEKIVHFVEKYVLKFLMVFIPIILFSSFATLAYSNKFQEFFVVDIYLSLLIVASQIA